MVPWFHSESLNKSLSQLGSSKDSIRLILSLCVCFREATSHVHASRHMPGRVGLPLQTLGSWTER